MWASATTMYEYIQHRGEQCSHVHPQVTTYNHTKATISRRKKISEASLCFRDLTYI
jgi:hypothetical protein